MNNEFNEFFDKTLNDVDRHLQYTILSESHCPTFKGPLADFVNFIKEEYLKSGQSQNDYNALFDFVKNKIEAEHESVHVGTSVFFPTELFEKRRLKK